MCRESIRMCLRELDQSTLWESVDFDQPQSLVFVEDIVKTKLDQAISRACECLEHRLTDAFILRLDRGDELS